MFNCFFENMPVIFGVEECHVTLGHMRCRSRMVFLRHVNLIVRSTSSVSARFNLKPCFWMGIIYIFYYLDSKIEMLPFFNWSLRRAIQYSRFLLFSESSILMTLNNEIWLLDPFSEVGSCIR